MASQEKMVKTERTEKKVRKETRVTKVNPVTLVRKENQVRASEFPVRMASQEKMAAA